MILSHFLDISILFNHFMYCPLALCIAYFKLVCLRKLVNVNVVGMFSSSPSLMPQVLIYSTRGNKSVLYRIAFLLALPVNREYCCNMGKRF